MFFKFFISRLSILIISALILPAPVTYADPSPFRIGVSLPLTGAFAEYGEAVRNGVELAREDAKGNATSIIFLYEDDSYEPRKGVVAFQKFRTVEKVNFIFAWGIEPSLAIAPIAEREKFPIIAGSLDPRTIKDKKYVVNAFAPYEEYSCRLAKILNDNGFKHLGLIKSEVSLFDGLSTGVRNCLLSGQSLELIDSFIPGDQDFRSAITKLKNQHYDAVGVYLTTPQLFTFFKQAAELKYKTQFFGPTLFYSRDLVKNAATELTGSFFAHNIASKEFSDRYINRFKNDTHVAYAAHAYEIARFLQNRFGETKARRAEEIQEILSRPYSNDTSVAGIYELKSYSGGGRYFSFPPGIYRISSDQKFELIDKK